MKQRLLKWIVPFLLLAANTSFSQNAGDDFFETPIIHEVNINFYEGNYWDSLIYYKDQDDLTGVSTYMHADITIDTVQITDVGVRLRGNSSYEHIGKKKPLKLDFNEFVSGQKFDGLKKLNFNNGYLDPSMMREKLYLDFLNRQGLNAPRCTYAKVYFNGDYVGIYKSVEQIDKTFLQKHIGNNDGNLYKGEPHAPLKWEGNDQSLYYDNFELKTNEDSNDWSGLVNLHAVVDLTTSNIYNEFNQVLNTSSYIKTWAANNLFGNLDSYMFLPHNYYLYHNSVTGKFEWITWDVSLAFGVYVPWLIPEGETFDIFYLPDPQESLPLNRNMLAVDAYRELYMQELCKYLNHDFRIEVLGPQIDSIADAIRPAIYAEPDNNQMFSEAEFESNIGGGTVNSDFLVRIPGLKAFVSQRRGNVTEQLCENDWSCALGQSFKNLSDEEYLQVYPNPSTGLINIRFNVPEEKRQLEYYITDLLGRIVYYEKSVYTSGDNVREVLLETAAGVYVLTIEGGCRDITRKIIVAK
jgi:spore coat protein H